MAKNDVSFDPNSFIDPMARVFQRDGNIYRAFFPQHSDFYRQLIASPALTELMAQGKIVRTEIEPAIQVDGFDLVVRHQRVDTRSYCFEWPFSMLKDAALLTLDIGRRMLAEKILLQDASAYNVYFEGARPIFIDFSSLVPDSNDHLWAAYQQFCHFFLFPLYVHASGKSTVALKLLKDSPDGLTAGETASVLGTLSKLGLKGYFSRLALPEFFAKRFDSHGGRLKMGKASSKLMQQVDTQKTRVNFMASLAKTVEALGPPSGSGRWLDYYDQTDAEVLAAKQEAVSRILSELQPRTLLDVGCNLGTFSLLAARQGVKVTSFDIDPECVDHLYGQAQKEGLPILALTANLLNPSPSLGWRNREYAALSQRVRGELVLALALVHHLVFSGGWDFGRALDALGEFPQDALLIEYVDLDDPMARLLPRRPGVDYGWYTLENFRQALDERYGQVSQLGRLSDTRVLFLASEPEK